MRGTTRLLLYKQPAVELQEYACGRSADKSGVCCRDHEAAAMPIGSLSMAPNHGWPYVSCARCRDAEQLLVAADAILCWGAPAD
jgi:hypothetical protein